MRTFTSILVDLDATASAQPALDRAVELARCSGAALKIVDVAGASGHDRGRLRADLDDALMRRRREQLARISYGVRGVAVDCDLLAGPPAEALIQDVRRCRHDLVVRSHTRDIASGSVLPLGVVDVTLLRQCPCDVWTVWQAAPPPESRIVVALDGNDDDPQRARLRDKVVDTALTLASLNQASLTLLHAWQPSFEARVQSYASPDEFAAYLESARRTAKERLRRIADTFGTRVAGTRFELRRGAVEEVVPQLAVAEGIDMVVIGARSRSGIARLLKSATAERLLGRLSCALWAVKADEQPSLTS